MKVIQLHNLKFNMVMKKIEQMKKLIPGSAEWEVTYGRLLEVEINKKML